VTGVQTCALPIWFFQALTQTQEKPALLNVEEIFSLYRTGMGKNYEQVLKLLPEAGAGIYEPGWLAAKILEQDVPAMEIAKSAVGAAAADNLAAILAQVKNGSLLAGDCKFQWIGRLLQGRVSAGKSAKPRMGRFDRLATGKTWGKPLAIGIIIIGLILSMVIAIPFMGLFGYLPGLIGPWLTRSLTSAGVPQLLISLLSDGILTAVAFALMMVSFVFASVWFSAFWKRRVIWPASPMFLTIPWRLGLQGKAIMPFLVSFGCNIGGVTGTRVSIPGASGLPPWPFPGSFPAPPPGAWWGW
jgi:ferrous iron transport protein B